jgi:hypothetical protein
MSRDREQPPQGENGRSPVEGEAGASGAATAAIAQSSKDINSMSTDNSEDMLREAREIAANVFESDPHSSGFDHAVAKAVREGDWDQTAIVRVALAALTRPSSPTSGDAVERGGIVSRLLDPRFNGAEGLRREAAGEIERLRAALSAPRGDGDAVLRLRGALRNIAEGNLGDGPGQANYARIRFVAAAALSPVSVEGEQEQGEGA